MKMVENENGLAAFYLPWVVIFLEKSKMEDKFLCGFFSQDIPLVLPLGGLRTKFPSLGKL